MPTENKTPNFAIILGYLLLGIVVIIGLGAIYNRFAHGMITTNLTQHVPWGLWVALYIYFIGLSAGSFLLSTLVYVFGVKKLEPIGPLSLIQALICLTLGLAAIVLDLGQPIRAYLVMIHGNNMSVLTWEARFYVIYGIIIVAEILIALRPGFSNLAKEGGSLAGLYSLLSFGPDFDRDKWKVTASKMMFVLGIIGIPVAIAVHGGTGALFAVVKARPYWFTGLFPIVFLVSALASGGGLLAFLAASFLKLEKTVKYDLVRFLANLTIYILVFDQLLLFFELLVIFYGGVPDEVIPWQYTIFGPTWSWTVFWFMQICVGVIIPAMLILVPQWGKLTRNLGLAGFLIVVGMMATRANIVIPAQLPPVIEGLDKMYPYNFRWETGYNPSMVEIFSTIGVLAIAVVLFILAFKLLPIQPHQVELHHEEGR